MTWEELYAQAKKLDSNYKLFDDKEGIYLEWVGLTFTIDGHVLFRGGEEYAAIAENKTYEQMYQIMLALQ